MRGAITTLKKELLSYAVSPVSWIIAVLLYLVRGFEVSRLADVFAIYKADANQFPAATYGVNSTYMMVLLVPGILTMRCFAEERRTGSKWCLASGWPRRCSLRCCGCRVCCCCTCSNTTATLPPTSRLARCSRPTLACSC